MHRIDGRWVLAAIAVGLAVLWGPVAPARAAASAGARTATAIRVATSTRTDAAIQARWQQLKPVYTGSPYVVTPSWTAPYSAGSLAAGFLQDGLSSINYARFLAGLPDDVPLDPTYTDDVQHGAVLLAAGQFAHSQPKPADMDQAFYDIANGATSSSNIGRGYDTLWSFNFGCLDDGDTGNIDRVGHRRWILYPALQKTGMGFANERSDTYVFDWSRTTPVSYDAIEWPSAGPFPVEMFGTSAPWSVTLNPALYSWTSGTAGHTVTLHRQRDDKTWTFTSADTNKSGEYFNFETSGYGVADCFIFRPDPASVGSYAVGDVFGVTISGGITNKASGTPATITYSTRFMSETGTAPADSTPPITSVTGVAAAWTNASVTFSLSATDTGSGVAHTYFKLGSGAQSTYTSPVTVLAEGVTTVSYWSVDNASNAEVAHTASIRIDKSAPVTTSDAVGSYAGAATIHLLPTDTRSGVASTSYSLDGGAAQSGTTVNVTSLGSHTLDFWSVDVAGNIETARTVTFVINDVVVPPGPVDCRLSKSPVGAAFTVVRHRGVAYFDYSARLEQLDGASCGAGKTAQLQKSADGKTWSRVRGASFLTDADGIVGVRLAFASAGTGYWRWVFAGDSEYKATSTSKSRIVVQ